MSDLVPVKRALISVSDKAGLAGFATALANEFGVTLLSTGGTAKFLRDAGLDVIDVSDVTGFPEMMDGRVKTLHPKVHGGLLAVRDNPQHVESMREHGIEPIDLVCINLYPFEKTVAKADVTFEEAIENIDIGGPSMVRSAAKNHAGVAVVTSPEQYEKTLGDLRKHAGRSCEKFRLKLATQAFVTTSAYDGAIAKYLIKQTQSESSAETSMESADRTPLRYGENPHQKAELHRSPCDGEASIAHARQHHGKELSYINVLDADAALACVKDFDGPAACIVKHATPCGVAAADSISVAVERAYASDPVAAFGGIVAVNVPLDRKTAEVLTGGQKFLEVVAAPSFDADALELLKARWKNVRLLETGPMFASEAKRIAFAPGLQPDAPAQHHRRLADAGARPLRRHAGRVENHQPPPAHARRTSRPARRVAGREAREIQRDHHRPRRRNRRHRRRASRPRRRGPHRHRKGRRPREGRSCRQRRVLPFPRRPHAATRRRPNGDRPTRRQRPRPRNHRPLQRPRRSVDLYWSEALPTLRFFF